MPKRRANGEGNIRKRKDGRWEGRYTVGHDPETGKAIIKNVLGKTQTEVKEKLKKAIEENVGIDYGRAKTYTVGNWLEVWYENYAKIKMRPSTYLTYHGYIENHIKPQLGKIPLNDLTTLHLQQFYKKLLAEGRVERIEAQKQPKGLSAKTVRNIHQIISSALKLAVEQRLIARNPADGCALPKVEHKEMKTLTADQLSAFFREAKDRGVFALYYIDLTTGLRRGELLGLKWSDIDLEKGDIRVQRQIGRIDGKIIEMPLKTKNAYRTLPLSADAISVLMQQRRKTGKLVAIVLGFQIAVGSTRPDELAVLHGLPLLRSDLSPNVQSVGFVYHVPQRNDDTGMGVLRGDGIEVFIDRNKADVADAEILLNVVAGVDGVPPQTGEVFHNDAVDVTSLNI